MGSTVPQVLNTLGHDFVRSFVSVLVETFSIAIYAVMVLKAVHILCRHFRNSLTTKIHAGVITALFILAIILWIIDCVNVVEEARISLLNLNMTVSNLGTSFEEAEDLIMHREAVQAALYSYMSVIGDAVIVWRVYAFWPAGAERLAVLIPASILLASCAVSLMLTYCVARLGSAIVVGTFQKPAFCRNIQTASYSTAVVTTFCATSLIALKFFKAWKYRQTSELFQFAHSQQMTGIEKVMLLLMESGVFYLVFFFAQLFISVPSINESIESHSGLKFAASIFDDVTSVIVGLYPTLVILLAYPRTIVEESVIGSRSMNVTFSRVMEDSDNANSERSMGIMDIHLQELGNSLSSHRKSAQFECK